MSLNESEPTRLDRKRSDTPTLSAFWHPVVPANMDGLFSLEDYHPIEVSTEWNRGYWLFSGEHNVAEDFLTSTYLYSFGSEPFKRVVFERPGRYGLALLRERSALRQRCLRELPPASGVLSFGVRQDKEAFWSQLLSSRRAWYKAVFGEGANQDLSLREAA